TTLSSGITAAATTMSVPSAAGFPAGGSYRVRVDDEDMTVTAGAGGTTWTITRASNGTTAAAHSAGAGASLDLDELSDDEAAEVVAEGRNIPFYAKSNIHSGK